MSVKRGTLHMLCGKIASGKSTLAAQLVDEHGAVLVVEDAWLQPLFGDRMRTGADFLHYSGRLRAAMGPHIVALLDAGVTVVLDFQANTIDSRTWMRGLIEDTGADHTMHFLDTPDAVCLARLHARNASGDHPFQVTDDMFHQFARHFVPPSEEEGFTILVHRPPA